MLDQRFRAEDTNEDMTNMAAKPGEGGDNLDVSSHPGANALSELVIGDHPILIQMLGADAERGGSQSVRAPPFSPLSQTTNTRP
jgi:hypothetical protein